jgi:hypothetical protein
MVLKDLIRQAARVDWRAGRAAGLGSPTLSDLPARFH